ncbi:hypothetical protein GDO78_022154 [Eleutherodactylus coqui]|uniref:Uncharacterized protein n=1 Tax=Eleutherodactylus coqui TaxID=57060 RepID=A0A8J6C4X3_ELECQ|nr:hypothetical protein GDO78_022154 [Eleutherodactylus coqui]
MSPSDGSHSACSTPDFSHVSCFPMNCMSDRRWGRSWVVHTGKNILSLTYPMRGSVHFIMAPSNKGYTPLHVLRTSGTVRLLRNVHQVPLSVHFWHNLHQFLE